MCLPTASSYFAQFPHFVPNPSASVQDEFARLAKAQKWGPKSEKYKEERRDFLLSEYSHHVGCIQATNAVSPWQDLCRELGIDDPPESISRCKKALRKIHVNIVDLIDSRRQGTRVTTFGSQEALKEYTTGHKKIFPKHRAKQDMLLKVLLREIF